MDIELVNRTKNRKKSKLNYTRFQEGRGRAPAFGESYAFPSQKHLIEREYLSPSTLHLRRASLRLGLV
jgi:hypothetical protein